MHLHLFFYTQTHIPTHTCSHTSSSYIPYTYTYSSYLHLFIINFIIIHTPTFNPLILNHLQCQHPHAHTHTIPSRYVTQVISQHYAKTWVTKYSSHHRMQY